MQVETTEILLEAIPETEKYPEELQQVIDSGDDGNTLAFRIVLNNCSAGTAFFSSISEKGARVGFTQHSGNPGLYGATEIVRQLCNINQSSFGKTVLFSVIDPGDEALQNAYLENGFRTVGRIDSSRLLLELKQEDQPLLSILSLSYNHEKFIGQALEGMLNQQCNFEYTIVLGDDCSTDGSAAAIYSYYKRHPHRFRLTLQEKNLGITANARFLLQRCNTRYIAICECDDYWTYGHKLQRQIDLLESNPGYSACFHNADVLDEKSGKTEAFEKMPKDVFNTADIVAAWYAPTHSLVFRREALALPEWLWHIYTLDYAFQLLLSLKGDLYCIDEKWGVYRSHAGGVSQALPDRALLARNMIKLLSYFNIDSHFKYDKEVETRMIYFLSTMDLKPFKKIHPMWYNLRPDIFVQKLWKRLKS